MEIEARVKERATQWLSSGFDKETRDRVSYLIENDPKELSESFYRDLEFGTGGLRGIMGVGTNRMNHYTVGMATQGLANYLLKQYGNSEIKIAVAYDCRNNNTVFAETVASVMSANGIRVFLFDDLRPTPELSFAIRYLGCQSGIVITASHNPKEYNGYKVYWEDGGQIIAPHDKGIIEEVRKISGPSEVMFEKRDELITMIGQVVDAAYIESVKSLSLSPEIIARYCDMTIVYTPIHGTGVHLAPLALKAFGFTNIIGVEEQNVISGNFPTVHSPNPEEPAALDLAIRKAMACGASLVMATDPDADRVGIAVRNKDNEFVLLNGNQAASLLIYYVTRLWKEKGKLKGNEFIVKTIVTTELLARIAEKSGIKYYDVLTGFKYIADIIERMKGKEVFIAGGEESYGYLVGDAVRDKDAIGACCMIAETAAWASSHGKSLYDLLQEIYVEFGYFKESLVSLTRKGREGVEEIAAMMESFRKRTPTHIAGIKINVVKDYQASVSYNIETNTQSTIDLPTSDVIQFFLEDGSKITVRPSGTEPKIKFYFGLKGTLRSVNDFEALEKEMDLKLNKIKSFLNL
ncbi:MAG: phospho-sugar mutase [Bacteroidales bacterium]|nr:phospho-sugar mutase [Bacteroidales bacterium]